MSLPAALAGQSSMASMVAISPMDGFLQIFNNNPYFIGVMMLILNLGGRFISMEVTKKQELFFQHPWVRRILIFTVLFVATRNLWVAFWTTVTVVLFLGYLFNENSALCIFGQLGANGSTCSDSPKPGEGMTPEEKEILLRLSSKAQKYAVAEESAKGVKKTPEQAALSKGIRATGAVHDADEEDDVLHTDIYAANLQVLKN
uniref:Uncharacterized protein n=1 Tax=viral metagenome TaxID=1070528 RepID=A0A6C0KS85_9ZZZZ